VLDCINLLLNELFNLLDHRVKHILADFGTSTKLARTR
jgi:hypothetical protein